MTRLLPASLLEPLLQEKPALVDRVLATIYNGWEFQHTRETLSDVASVSGLSTAQLLSDTLEHDEVDQQFLSILRAQGTDLKPVTGFTPATFDDVEDDTSDPVAQGNFNIRAMTSRCRIMVGGKVMGSGALVSRRLVLTAAHVIQDALDESTGQQKREARLQVKGADGKDYPAWVVFMSPVHENEINNLPAPDSAYDSHADVALLRTYKPLGRSHKFGHFDMARPLPTGTGTRRLWLVHFPNGQDTGYSIGRYKRETARSMYLPHDAETNPGSSGGAAFDGNFAYIGHHQGEARLVPFDRYINNAKFKTALSTDHPPKYLWSLDESIDGHMIIGRDAFFDALTAIVEGTAVALKGIWVRRMDTSQDVGLSFSYRILNAFLQAHDSKAQTHRISLDLLNDDLLDVVAAQALEKDTAALTGLGAADGGTSLAASDKDRAKALATVLQSRAEQTGETHWFYFDNPPSGLSRTTQVQLEHLVAELLICPDLRVVLSGFETFSLVDRQFETIMEARDHGPPGLYIEFIGEFTQNDLRQTVALMTQDLGLGWVPAVIDFVVKSVLKNLHSVAGAFPASASAEVAQKLRTQIRTLEGME